MVRIIGMNGPPKPRSDAYPALDRIPEMMRTRRTLRWGRLYALGLCGIVLVVVAGEISAAGWRAVVEGLVSGLTLGALGLWVRANRLVLAMESRADIAAEGPEDTIGMPGRPRTPLTLRQRAA